MILLAGCASPGPPLPPTLNLPAVVSTGLTATRVGDEVKLHWTTPERTTDKLLTKGTITAVVCRQTVTAPVRAGEPAAACASVARLPVTPGGSDAADPLPASLTAGPTRLLAYRVELLNVAGRTAGPSMTAYAAAGPSVAPVAQFVGKATKTGVVLEWKRAEGKGDVGPSPANANEPAPAIELDRTTVAAPAVTATAAAAPAQTAQKTVQPGKPAAKIKPSAAAPERKGGLPGMEKEPAEVRFQAGSVDAGGTIDRSARIGYTYRYTAQRVRSVTVGGQTLELRSIPSVAVTIAVEDVFPPDVPSGLVAVPGVASGVAEQTAPAIDLSWEPNMEPRIVGYRVYRRDLDGLAPDAWLRLDAEPLRVTSYRDLNVAAGQRYAYRVTAVNEAGHESERSGEVVETAP